MLEFKVNAKVQTPYERVLSKFQGQLSVAFCRSEKNFFFFEEYIDFLFSESMNRNILETSGILKKEEKLPPLLVLIHYILEHKNKPISNVSLTAYFSECNKNTKFALLIIFAMAGLSEAQEALSDIINTYSLEVDFWNTPLTDAKGLTSFWILSKFASSNLSSLAVSFYLALVKKRSIALLDWNAKIESEKQLSNYFSVHAGTTPFFLLCNAPIHWREEVLKILFNEVAKKDLDWTAGITGELCSRSPFWVLTTEAVKGEKWAQAIFDRQILNYSLSELDGWSYSEGKHKTPYEQLSEGAISSIWAAKTKTIICNHPSFLGIAISSFATHKTGIWGEMAVEEFLKNHDIAKVNWNETIKSGSFRGASIFSMLFKFVSISHFAVGMESAVIATMLLERILASVPLHLLDWNKKRENYISDHSPFQQLITLNGVFAWKKEILRKLICQSPIIPLPWNERLAYSFEGIATPLHHLIRQAQIGYPDLLIAFLSRKEHLEMADFNTRTRFGTSIVLDLTPPLSKAVFLLREDYKNPTNPLEYSDLASKLSSIFCKYWNFANALGADMPLLLMRHYVKAELNPIVADIPLELHEVILDSVTSRLQKAQAKENDVMAFNASANEVAEKLSKKSYVVTARVAALRRSGYEKFPRFGFFNTLIEVFDQMRGTSYLLARSTRMRNESKLILNALQRLSDQGDIPTVLDREVREEVVSHLVPEIELRRENVENKITQALLFVQCKKRGLTVLKLDREAPPSKRIKPEISAI